MLSRLLQFLQRKSMPVTLPDYTRIQPISTVFGMDRGTPIDRWYIERFLESHSRLIRGNALEIGEATYSKRYGGDRVEAFEILHATADNKAATIVGNLADPKTLPEGKVDCFICTQTFNFIYEVQQAVKGAHHLLKPGGVLLATVAGICQVSRHDMDRWGDYWRFTTASIQRMFEPVFRGGVEVKSHGNVLAATALLHGMAVEDLPDPRLLDAQDPDYQVVITLVARKAP